jgi:hypothetical protein
MAKRHRGSGQDHQVRISEDVMEFVVSEAVSILSQTPAVVSGLVVNLPERWVRVTEGPGTFSPFDVVGHLVDGEETDWMPRARTVLAQGPDRRFEPYDRLRHRARNADRTIQSLSDEFSALRAANLASLCAWNLTESQLDLRGEHPAFGPVTLRQLLAAWVVHDLGHIAQIARVMAKQYVDEAGPWVEFLPILTDRPVPRT